MSLVSRQELREALATLIRTRSTLAQQVFEYLPSDFAGASPIVVLTGSGSERPRVTSRGVKTKFHFTAETFVLYSDPEAVPPWTTQNAENTLDGLEKEIAEIVSDNPTGPCWSYLEYEFPSSISKVTIGGVAYLYESIPLIAEVL